MRIAQAGGNHGVDVTEEDRLHGGHTFERHVGKSDDYLTAGILDNRVDGYIMGAGEKRAGSFNSVDAANKLVNSRLSDLINAAKIRAFSEKQFLYSLPWLFVFKTFSSPTGYEVYAKGKEAPRRRTTYGVTVELRRSDKNERGYYVHSAWPMNED